MDLQRREPIDLGEIRGLQHSCWCKMPATGYFSEGNEVELTIVHRYRKLGFSFPRMGRNCISAHTSTPDRLGRRSASDLCAARRGPPALEVDGWYARLRHPLLAGVVLTLFGEALAAASLAQVIYVSASLAAFIRCDQGKT